MRPGPGSNAVHPPTVSGAGPPPMGPRPRSHRLMPHPAMRRAIIMGAAGRDFHNFNVYWKSRTDIEVVCFPAAQIPDIAGRLYPPGLAGPRYPRGIPIHPEERLEELLGK